MRTAQKLNKWWENKCHNFKLIWSTFKRRHIIWFIEHDLLALMSRYLNWTSKKEMNFKSNPFWKCILRSLSALISRLIPICHHSFCAIWSESVCAALLCAIRLCFLRSFYSILTLMASIWFDSRNVSSSLIFRPPARNSLDFVINLVHWAREAHTTLINDSSGKTLVCLSFFLSRFVFYSFELLSVIILWRWLISSLACGKRRPRRRRRRQINMHVFCSRCLRNS